MESTKFAPKLNEPFKALVSFVPGSGPDSVYYQEDRRLECWVEFFGPLIRLYNNEINILVPHANIACIDLNPFKYSAPVPHRAIPRRKVEDDMPSKKVQVRVNDRFLRQGSVRETLRTALPGDNRPQAFIPREGNQTRNSAG